MLICPLQSHVPVVLTNESDHDVIVPQRCIIGEISVFQKVLSQEHSVLTSKSDSLQKSDITFNFSDSPVPAEWKEHITWKLNSMPEVFAQNDLDFQRLMERCVGDMNLKEVLVFLDDIIVFSKTLEEHEVRLMKVLNRLREFGLNSPRRNASSFKHLSSTWGILYHRMEWGLTLEKWRP